MTNQRIRRTWDAHVAISIKKHEFWGPFWHRFFIIFVNVQKPWNQWQFYTFTTFWQSKTAHFPIKFSLFFHVFSKPLPRTVFRGSRCRSLLKNWISGVFGHFAKCPKAPFGRHFREKCHRQLWVNPAGTDVFWTASSGHFVLLFDRLLAPFWPLLATFWYPFRSMLVHIGPFGSTPAHPQT